MPIKFPITKITIASKYAFIHLVKERLCLEHGMKLKELRTDKITRKQFDTWVNSKWDNWYRTVTKELLELRKTIQNNNPMSINIEKVVT